MSKYCYIAVGVFPPPITGQSAAFKKFVDFFLPKSRRINVSGGPKPLSKVLKILLYSFAFIRLPFLREKNVYYSLNSGYGLYLDLFFLIGCKLMQKRIILHHHSYGYINIKNPVVTLISNAMDDDDVMIFLSKMMLDDFESVYGLTSPSLSLNNIFQYPDDVVLKQRVANDVLMVGYISNITVDKGFLILCDLIELVASDKNSQCQFVIAGDFYDEESKARFDRLSANAKKIISYRGPVFGEDKSVFFSSLDILVFPTIYKNEAQPMVLVESLLHGVPVLSTNRGAISDLIGQNGGSVIDDADFINTCVSVLRSLCKSDSLLNTMSRQSHEQYLALKEISRSEVATLKNVLHENDP